MMNKKAQKLVFEFYRDVGDYIKNEYHPKWFRYYTNEEFIIPIMESVKLYYFGGNTIPFVAGQIVESLERYGKPKRKNI